MSRLTLFPVAVFVALTTVCAPLVAYAQSAEQRGTAIAERNDRTDRGWRTSSVNLTMTLTTRAGQSTSRQLRFDSIEKQGEGNGDKTLVTFDTPADVRGTILLSHAKILASDDQWLFLPQLRQVRRISSANKSGPFVGSEFAFEDLTGGEFGKYSYKYLETKTINGAQVDVVECTPRYERSGYSKINCYFDTRNYQLRRLEFFNRANQLSKTLVLDDLRAYPGGFIRSHSQTMTNNLTGRVTTLRFGTYRFGVPLNQRDFEAAALERR
jgi:outer membrane lipoprotein-sorting protein